MRAPSLSGLFVSHWHVSWSLIAIGVLYGALYVWAAVKATARWPV